MLCPKWGKRTASSTLSIDSENLDPCSLSKSNSHQLKNGENIQRAMAIAEIHRKNGASLGLGIDGGADKSTPPLISRLRPGSIAHRCDDLQIGDWLIEVNGIKVLTLKNEDILVLLRNATELVTLTVEYDLNCQYFKRPSQTKPNSTDIYLKKENGSFGFTVRGGSYGPDADKSLPLTVTAIRPGGPADREGRIRVGDRLISIDGTDVSSSTLISATALLRKITTKSVCLTIEYDRVCFDSVKNVTGPFSLDLHKIPGSDFGITLKLAENDQEKTVTISSITEASVADRCGALYIGDEIQKIDDMTLEYSTLPEVYQLLKNNDRSHIRLEIKPYDRSKGVIPLDSNNNHEKSINGKPLIQTADQNGHYHQNGGILIYDHKDQSSTFSSKFGRSSMRSKNTDTVDSKYARIKFLDDMRHIETIHIMDQYAKVAKDARKKKNSVHHNKRAKSIDTGQHNNASFSHFGRSDDHYASSLNATISNVPCGQVCRSETMELALNTWTRGGYGFIVHRNQNQDTSSHSGRNGLYVSYIERGSPADKSGVLQIGDRILMLNDWCTMNGTADEANYIIRHANGPLNLTVEFDIIETVSPCNGIFTVKLAKRGQNLGIVIHPGATGHKGEPVVVKEVKIGSVAHRCGSIQTEDQLLSIDNIPLDTCTVDEAMRLLQKSSDIVKLRVKKNYANYEDMEPTTNTIVYTVEMCRKGAPLGITIASTDDTADPIIISHIASGGIVDKTGALHVGDRILAINNQSMNGKRVSEAVQLMQQNRDTVSFKIARFVVDQTRFHHHQSANNNSNHLNPHVLMIDRQSSDNYHDREGGEKLGTPVQSIDSAVESLEDSPMLESQQPSTSSNRNSQNSNSKASSLSGTGPPHDSHYAEDLHIQLHKTLSTLKSASSSLGGSSAAMGGLISHGCRSEASCSSTAPIDEEQNYVQLGGDSCPCKNHTHHDPSHHDWMQVLEALETVGEAEMLKKLEETILSGSVPNCGSGSSGMVDRPRPTTPKPPPKPSLNPPFPLMTNTILKHPYSHLMRPHHQNQLSSTTDSMLEQPRDILTCSMSALARLPSVSSADFASSSAFLSSSPSSGSTRPILSHYEHIPFLTSSGVACGASVVPNYGDNSTIVHRDNDNDDSPPISIRTDNDSPEDDEHHLMMQPMNPIGQQNQTSLGGANVARQQPIVANRIPPGVQIFRVSLRKDPTYNDFGFSVSDGIGEKGVFINKIRPRGPAEMSGNVKPYDKLLQVNETNLRDLDCLLAVPVLAAAGDKIDLILCRDPSVNLARRPDSIEEEDEEDSDEARRLTPEQTQV